MEYPAHDRPFTFAEQRAEWEHVPVETVGYPRAGYLLAKSDGELVAMAAHAACSRYNEDRNPGGVWHRLLHEPHSGKHVMDFGCGFGLESLQLAIRGCAVTLVDINQSNVDLAARVISAHSLERRVRAKVVATDQPPYFDSPAGPIDVFYSCGVLHHIPYPREILLRACELLVPGGRITLMLYTDEAWRQTTGQPCPPVDDDTSKNPHAPRFRASFDCVGRWADWYSKEKLEHRFGDFLDVLSWDRLNLNGVYAAATLKRKGDD